MGIEILESRDFHEVSRTSPDDRAKRLQWLLRQMMQEAVRENNEELCKTIRESVIKELDYQFRMQEERAEVREQENLQRSEEYYRRIDELLRQRSNRKKTGFSVPEGRSRAVSAGRAESKEADIRRGSAENTADQKEETEKVDTVKKTQKKGALEFIFLNRKQG